MYESAALAVWRQLSRGGVLEAFNDGRLAGAIVADDEGQRGVELDGLADGRAEGPDARDGELIDSRHAGPVDASRLQQGANRSVVRNRWSDVSSLITSGAEGVVEDPELRTRASGFTR